MRRSRNSAACVQMPSSRGHSKRGEAMNRGKVVLAAAALALVTASGCGWREGRLLSKYRARGAAPECPCPPYMNGYGMEGFGGGMPVSMPNGGAPCPCTTMPGSVMPGAGIPEYMQPQPMPNGGFPMMPPAPGAFPGTVTPPPGSATPRPAEPSDPTSTKKTNGIATSKPGLGP